MSSLIWLFVCKFCLTWHLTIEFPVPSTDLEKETELEAWKSPLHCMKDGENTLGRFVPSQVNSQEFLWFFFFLRLSQDADYPSQILHSAAADFNCTCFRHLSKKKTKQCLKINWWDSLSLFPQLHTLRIVDAELDISRHWRQHEI